MPLCTHIANRAARKETIAYSYYKSIACGTGGYFPQLMESIYAVVLHRINKHFDNHIKTYRK